MVPAFSVQISVLSAIMEIVPSVFLDTLPTPMESVSSTANFPAPPATTINPRPVSAVTQAQTSLALAVRSISVVTLETLALTAVKDLDIFWLLVSVSDVHSFLTAFSAVNLTLSNVPFVRLAFS